MTMTTTDRLLVSGAPPPTRTIRMTGAALRRLEQEVDRLQRGMPALEAAVQEHGFSGDREAPTILPFGDHHLAARRLEALLQMLANAHVVEPDGAAVIGSRVTVRDGAGDEEEQYELVSAGESNPRAGRISCDSPLGATLLGRRAGDTVDVATPAGTRRLHVVAVA